MELLSELAMRAMELGALGCVFYLNVLAIRSAYFRKDDGKAEVEKAFAFFLLFAASLVVLKVAI